MNYTSEPTNEDMEIAYGMVCSAKDVAQALAQARSEGIKKERQSCADLCDKLSRVLKKEEGSFAAERCATLILRRNNYE